MTDNVSAPPVQYTIILIGLLVGVGFYAFDIIIDVFVFNHGTVIEHVLHPTKHEIWMRTFVFILAMAFAILVQLLLKRERETSNRAKMAETFLSIIFDNIPNMIFIKDAEDLHFVRINKTGEMLLGLSNQELTGKNDFDYFTEEQAAFFTQKDREVLKAGIGIDIPAEVIDTASLGKRWLHTKKVPILDDRGKPVYLLGISEDITEARQAELELNKTEIRFQTLFNSAADMIFVIDPDGHVMQTNRHACDLSGYEKHEIVGSHVRKFFSPESKDTCDRNFPELRESGYSRADIEFVCKDGHIIQVECIATGVPDESGCFTSFLIIQRDVPEKKLAQEEKQRQPNEIAHVMRLSTMGEMASGMAHELNQPLTALTSYCSTAIKLAQDATSLPKGYIDILERATEQAHRAGDVIRHLRDFVSKGNQKKARIFMDDLINDVIDLVAWERQDKDIRVTFHPGYHSSTVLVDKVQIEQVLINLIRNSIEAIREAGITEGQVDIETRLTEEGSVIVSVADNGPGIDPAIAGSLFEPYQTSKENGLGMGLSISQSIVEAHDGRLWADLNRQKGALFNMSLPGCD